MKELKVEEEVRIRCVEDYSRIPECPKCCFYHECNPLEMRCQSHARTDGNYWSYASDSQAYARNLLFYSGGVYPLGYYNRAYGFSVRLCREV